ncbi:DUF177 domain-containing protein [Roseovarius spongiae]|uniref:DUF177 domain-containing protein n=1 Tax=Roseovarius spongiae TaxID=2320272 RepID=A0A3A8BBZ1_9RHOB|nr:DUF177 domain-containing protein [Roseovarius spongiae]RKF17074.1 DUF177 domain-containing protein [Roseovarius spongiae]
MTDSPKTDEILRINDLRQRRATQFSLVPDGTAREALTRALDILAIRKLRFEGALAPEGGRDWRLDGTLGATVVQPCVVTLEPVTTRIEVPVTRRFLADMPDAPQGEDEVEMPEDDTIEPLGATVDLGQIMAEALALALPDYPRAPGVELGETVVAPPGAEPLRDADLKPFAGLAALRGKLGKEE